jgi:hypothetical protein
MLVEFASLLLGELKGVSVLEGYFIQYKFIIPSTTQHSSYTYQKLFRALYGYTQKVSKASGKSYSYHRKGILSNVPFIRPGKNAVIIPKEALSELLSFFKTGKNPSHHWRVKGDWKCVYYMDEKKLDENMVTIALESLLDRTTISTPDSGDQHLLSVLVDLGDKKTLGEPFDETLKAESVKLAYTITSLPWFRELSSKSKKLKEFNDKYKEFKQN